MAAFCTCCGSAITSKVERCLVCGTPRHGMKIISTPLREPVTDESSSDPESKDRLSIA